MNRALLLTDVVDSTRLSEQLGDVATAALWAKHDRVARDLLPVHRGREIDKTDGFLLLFETAEDAVAYALAYHRAIAELGLKARAGLHVGPVILTENAPADVALGAKPLEVDGLAKPVAARVMSVAIGGQTLLTREAMDELGATPLRTAAHGHWRMKGVAEPVELFEVGDEDAAMTPPPDGAKVWRVVQRDGVWLPLREVRHALPAERDAFVGRAADLRALADLLDQSRVVSVLGMGGTGKTRLVARFAWTWLGDYPGGAWFCDLSEARSVQDICHAVATALDVPLGKDDPVVQLGHAIAGRGACLVVLDNFEQVARHAGETLGRWLDRARDARFVVTTREVLGLPGESALALAPLDRDEAVGLFVARARQARQGFVLDDEPSVRALVALLDGLPLAIELAAARVRVMPPKTLLERMSQRFKLLASTGGRHTRQATLKATFDWSWDLLSEDERTALAQLSVFEGGFTLEAAEGVLALPDLWPADAVQALVDRSWVRAVSDDRFDLLVSVQEYAAEKLDAAGGRADAEARHGAWFARFGERGGILALYGQGGHAQRRALRLDLDNLVAACRRASARGDAEVAAAAGLAAFELMSTTGPMAPMEALAGQVLALDLAPLARVRTLRMRGFALVSLVRPSEARACFDEALAIANAIGDRALQAAVLLNLGVLNAHQGRKAEARACVEEALVALPSADIRDRAAIVMNRALLLYEENRVEEARAGYEEAMTLARAGGNRTVEGLAIGNLGSLEKKRGNIADALRCFEQALVIHREAGDRRGESSVRCNLGSLYNERGQAELARAQYEAALALARDVGDRREEGIALGNLGNLAQQQGQKDVALRCYEQALAIHEQLGNRLGGGITAGNVGLLHVADGRMAEARRLLERALAVHRELGFGYGQGYWLWGLAQVESAEGSDGWVGRADEAVSVSAPYPLVHANALAVRGRLRLDHGDVGGARADVDAARALGQGGSVGALVATTDARIRAAEGRADAAREALRDAERLAEAAHLGPASPTGVELAAVRALLDTP